jgi:uncharacterized Rmd1/YagE family protein
MKTLSFYSFKAGKKLPIMQLASYFNIKQDAGWREFVKIGNKEVEKILKYASPNKAVYLYRYGCITFLNFDINESHVFMEYLNKLTEARMELLSRFYETHTIIVGDDGYAALWEDDEEKVLYSKNMDDIVASILAKSTELSKIESELSKVLDEADNFILHLKKGRLRADRKKVIPTIAKCIRFKYMTVESARILDRPSEFGKTIESRHIFEKMSKFYELSERYSSFSSRTDVLDSITGEYFDFGDNQAYMRLLKIEIILLGLFPLMHLFE